MAMWRRTVTRRHLAMLAVLLLLAAWEAVDLAPARAAERPRNIIIMVADGAASTQWDFGRYSSAVLRQQPFATTDVVFRRGVVGLLATHPHDAYVTDSAAAASAMSIGAKVKNGAVSITPDGQSPPTVMEAAKAAGKRIGLVTTAAVYDATPAAFALHARSRRDSQALVDQLLALEPDVLMGGGADHFLPDNAPGGQRKDGRDVIATFRAKGYAVARDTAELAAVSAPKLLALFATDDMDFELDRDPAREPTTAEMAAAALKALGQQSPNGFVLLVENENIDTAAHRNDTASLMRALWAFDDAVKVALEFQRRHPETLVIVTGDHETGGFSPTYALKDLSSMASSNRFYSGDEHLRMLGRITTSFDAAAGRLGKPPSGEALDQLLARHFPGFRLDPDLRELILGGKTDERTFIYLPHNALGRMVARQTGYYWGTSGHTPQPVLVGALGPGAPLFHGYQDNTDFGRHLHRLIRGQ
jgi:alkaline phosphatase